MRLRSFCESAVGSARRRTPPDQKLQVRCLVPRQRRVCSLLALAICACTCCTSSHFRLGVKEIVPPSVRSELAVPREGGSPSGSLGRCERIPGLSPRSEGLPAFPHGHSSSSPTSRFSSDSSPPAVGWAIFFFHMLPRLRAFCTLGQGLTLRFRSAPLPFSFLRRLLLLGCGRRSRRREPRLPPLLARTFLRIFFTRFRRASACSGKRQTNARVSSACSGRYLSTRRTSLSAFCPTVLRSWWRRRKLSYFLVCALVSFSPVAVS